MNLDKGEYFVITRGPKIANIPSFLGLMMGDSESWKQPKDDEARYDRSYEGMVFQAMAVADQVVAAKVIKGRWPMQESGSVMSLHLRDIEIMTVGKDYIEALGIEENR